VALKSFRTSFSFVLLSLIFADSILPSYALAKSISDDAVPSIQPGASFGHSANRLTKNQNTLEASFIALEDFTQRIKNGEANQLVGVYVKDVLAARIIQQPAGSPEFVSPRGSIVTQFSNARQFSSTGLLAHNYLAGATFHSLHKGQLVQLIYGDGHLAEFVVNDALQYQAVNPKSPTSDFIDLSNGERLTAAKLFQIAYNHPGSVIFQTCINAEGNKSWGRLFVIAIPSSQN
jgi:hypothetical protein